MLSGATESAIAEALGSNILSQRPVSGGDINLAYRISTRDGHFFVKTQSGTKGPRMFNCEQSGLRVLRRSGTVPVPEAIQTGTAEDRTAFLILTWHEEVPPTGEYYSQLGQKLAGMHRCTSDSFGFIEDNFIGSLDQPNARTNSWSDFYAEMRVQPMLDLCSQYLTSDDFRAWDKVTARLPDLVACETPSLLHGDLWGGNAMNTSDGPLIYDPAVYYGDRLVDIAMSKLFGGFDSAFYRAYFEAYPATEDEMDRIELYQLYYLLVHLALFGRSYLGAVRRILERYA